MNSLNTLSELSGIQKVEPVGIPFKCPVCLGFGTVNWGKQICQSCNGKGYVLVPARQQDRDRRRS